MEYGKFDERLGRSSEKIWLLPLEEKERRLKEIFKKKMGYELDLENPKTYNEKLQWYKLYYSNPVLTRCIDKVTFKDYISEKIGDGYTAKLLKVWASPNEISFDELPDNFLIKSNCQDNGKYIKIVNGKENGDLEKLKEEIKTYWFNPINTLINGFCGGYHSMIPKVFAEEYIKDFSGEETKECKVFCFNGKPMNCYTQKNHIVDCKLITTHNYPISFYTLNWERINVQYDKFPPLYDAPKPYHFNEMIEISETLSKDFPHVRVDFMDTAEKLYIGELTFYSGGGFNIFEPREFDYELGKLFVLPH